MLRILVRGEEQCRAGTSGDTRGIMGPGDGGSLASTGEPGTSRREVSNENIPENMKKYLNNCVDNLDIVDMVHR